MKLINERDGLALGICNGFQALIKLGLVPYGEICGQKADSPTPVSYTHLDVYKRQTNHWEKYFTVQEMTVSQAMKA